MSPRSVWFPASATHLATAPAKNGDPAVARASPRRSACHAATWETRSRPIASSPS